MHRIRTTLAVLIATASLASAIDVLAQQISLQEAVARALERNLDLRSERFQPEISRQNIVIQDAAFDAKLTGTGTYGKTKDAYSGGTYDYQTGTMTPGGDGKNSNAGSASVGVSKLVSTGGTLGVQTSFDHDTSMSGGNYNFRPEDETGVYVTFTQPLLKGAWADVTLAELRKAKSALTAAQLSLRGKALDTVLDVSGKYWNVSYAHKSVELKKSSVEAAEKLLEETKAKHEAGLVSDVDLLQSQSSLSSKRQALTQARLNLAAAGDDLAAAMGSLLDEKGTAYSPETADLPSDFGHIQSFDDVWPKILSEDIDTLVQEESIRQADIDKHVADNGRKPQLDLSLKAGYTGAGDTEGDSYSSLNDRDGNMWTTSLNFSMPLGRREDVAKSRRASAQLEQAKIKLINVKQTLYKDARQAWRDIELGVERCESTKAAVEYQRQAFETAKAKYSSGLISFRELLDSETDYDNAQDDYIDALRNLAVARYKMARLDGSLPQLLKLESNPSMPSLEKPIKK
jgi:outer membrane protein TolC